MKLTITAYTLEDNKLDLENAYAFSGKQAGICYMADDYFSPRMQDREKAIKRFNQTMKTLHHSIADHFNITLLLEDIPKIIAMTLNSLRQYSTSEKSGRYTKIEGSTDEEKRLYDKWKNIFTEVIKAEYGLMDDKMASKLAMENARYILSVFSRTTMSYTTSIRQWNYIIGWIDNFLKLTPKNDFESKLQDEFKILKENLSFLKVENLVDVKNRTFDFLAVQVNSPLAKISEEHFGDTYTSIYSSSFVALGQAQRHRTLKYTMVFNPENQKYYIPPIIRNTPYGKEWLVDIRSISNLYPQGILVKVIERGMTEDFILKCKERICGRAQLEIAIQTKETAEKFYYFDAMPDILSEIVDTGLIKAKCQTMNCQEPCMWGARRATSRKI